MLTTDIKQIQQEFDMAEVDKRFAYKNINGYLVSLFAEDERRVLIINALIPEENEEEALEKIGDKIEEINKENGSRLTGYVYKDGEFEFSFTTDKDVYYFMGGFIQELTRYFKEEKIRGITHCCYCHKPLAKGDRVLIEYNSAIKNVHHECEDKIREESEGKFQDRNIPKATKEKGRVGAITACITTALLWSVFYALDLPFRLVSLVGLAVGFAAKKLYDLRGGYPGFYKIRTISITNMCSILLGTALGTITKYSRMASYGQIEKLGFFGYLAKTPGEIAANYQTLLIAYVLSLVICYDVFLSKGSVEVYDEPVPLFRHHRIY